MASESIKGCIFEVDNGGPGTKTITEDSSTGSILLTDNQVTSLPLYTIPGLQQVDRVFVVGEGGSGVSKDGNTQLTTIQSAVDAVPATASPTDRYLILIAAGTYVENVLVEKDGIRFYGLGGVVVRNSGAGPTFRFRGAAAVPTSGRLENLRIENTADGEACVRIDGGAGSTVANDEIRVQNCDLVASGVGGFQVHAIECNNIRVHECNSEGSSVTSEHRFYQCATVQIIGCRNGQILNASYDTGATIPATAGSSFVVRNSDWAGAATMVWTGAGSWVSSNSTYGVATIGGNQTAALDHVTTASFTINDTTDVTAPNCSLGTVSAAVGATLTQTLTRGEVTFTASATETVSFVASMPDTDYTVTLDSDLVPTAFTDIPRVASRTTAGFDISFGAAQTTVVRYAIARNS